MKAQNYGVVTQVIGPVVDVKFEGDVPSILNALEILGKKISEVRVVFCGGGAAAR